MGSGPDGAPEKGRRSLVQLIAAAAVAAVAAPFARGGGRWPGPTGPTGAPRADGAPASAPPATASLVEARHWRRV